MPSNKKPKIHDAFFKDGLTPVVAKGLIESYIHSDAIHHIDWSTLKVENTNFVSEILRQKHCDVLYSCHTLDGISCIYFLFEGQITSDKLLPYRLQRYKEAIIRRHVKMYKVVPVVFVLCLYLGSRSYEFSSDIHKLATDPDFARNAKSEKILVVNLKKQNDKELAKKDVPGLYQIILKQGNSKEILPWIRKNPKLVSLLLEQSFSDTGLAYLLAVEKKNDPDTVLDTLINLLPNSKKNIMNALHQLEERNMLKGRIEGIQEGMLKGIQEGMLKGIQEGMLKGKLEIAKQLILLTQDLKLVHKATKLSMKILLALQKELKG